MAREGKRRRLGSAEAGSGGAFVWRRAAGLPCEGQVPLPFGRPAPSDAKSSFKGCEREEKCTMSTGHLGEVGVAIRRLVHGRRWGGIRERGASQ
jgi:hypothetical protein